MFNGMYGGQLTPCVLNPNFFFAKQFFEPNQEHLDQLVVETLQAFTDAAGNEGLIKEWDKLGYANAALWNAVYSGRC
jgi:hypothetical protein